MGRGLRGLYYERFEVALLSAYTPDELTLDDNPQHLIGLVNRMRLFAAPNVIDQAQAVIRGIVEISLKPSVNLRKLATAELSGNRDPDLLLPFSLACRADLDHVSRPVLLRLRKHKMNNDLLPGDGYQGPLNEFAVFDALPRAIRRALSSANFQ